MKRLILGALAGIASSLVAPAALAQDVAAGKISFNKCMACHAIGEGAKNKVGPKLNGLDGRHSGTAEGYSYSDANKNSGITWNEAQFKDYIKDPRRRFPAPRWYSPASRTRKKPATSGRFSRNMTRTERSSEAPVRAGLIPHWRSQESRTSRRLSEGSCCGRRDHQTTPPSAGRL
jgi:cytochrome c